MGAGEYASVTNQNELVHAEVALEADMHARFPQQEHDELVERFASYGADAETARRMAEAVSRDPDQALRLHTREELGVDPQDLPSALLAGGMVVGRLTGRPLLPSGLRHLVLGALAVAVTYGIGQLIGAPTADRPLSCR